MNRIDWNDSMSVGHHLMDSQHRKVIELINDCIVIASEECFDQAQFMKILQELCRYAEVHFDDEERLLQQCEFEFIKAQMASHAIYRNRTEEFLDGDHSLEALKDVVKYLSFWWMHHIQVEDMAYKASVEGARVEGLQPIAWDDEKYDVGHPVLNQQHKKLIELLNEIVRLINQDEPEVSKIAYHYQRFYKFFENHLEKEEQLLEESGYPSLKEHKAVHAGYLDRVTDLSIDGFDDPETTQRLMLFLSAWWNEHILVQDMDYKSHFQSQTLDQSATVLIVDDAPEVLVHLKKVVESAGYRTISADSGEKALKILESEAPDLVLLDISMPGADGFEVCARIKSNPQHEEIPLIFVTSHTEIEKRLEGVKAGAVSYLTKPVNSSELLKSIEKYT